MSPKSVWQDFVYAGVVTKKAKHGSGEESYDTWRCPHCGELVEALKSDENRKGRTCANHFWKAKVPCAKRPETDLRGQPKPPTASATTTTEVPEAPVAAAAPVVGEPVITDDAMSALQKELIAAKIEREKATTRAQQAEAMYKNELIISERRKRERSEAYHDAGVPSPHSSDGEEERTKKRRAFKKTVARAPPAATPVPPAPVPRAQPNPTLHQHVEEQMHAEHAWEPEAQKSHRATSASTSIDDFQYHFAYVVGRSQFAAKRSFEAFHEDKHRGTIKKSAKVVMDVVIECKNKREAREAKTAKRARK